MTEDDSAPSDESTSWSAQHPTGLTPGVVFGLLRDKRERFVLYLLEARGGTIALEELASYVAAREQDTTPELLTAEMEQRVQQSLYHTDLPKLANYDIVTYDRDSGAVTLTETGEQLEPYLTFAKEREPDDVEAFLKQSTTSDG